MSDPAVESVRQTDIGFLWPLWDRTIGAPWLASMLVLVILVGARFYSTLGPPTVRFRFMLHCLVIWALPFILLTVQCRREIGLRGQHRGCHGLGRLGRGGLCALAVSTVGA